jgi:hypothetical protein
MILAIRAFRATIFAFNEAIEVEIAAISVLCKIVIEPDSATAEAVVPR